MATASREQRDYFRRVARQARTLEDADPPQSLEEMFDRLDRIRATHGSLATPGLPEGDGDLDSHLAFLDKVNELRRRGKIPPKAE